MTCLLIFAHNEEHNVKDAIESAKLITSNIYVVDIGSTDTTAAQAKNEGVHVIPIPFSSYVEPAREIAINKVSGEWVFIMDADERMTEELASEIKQSIKNKDYTYYKVPRKNLFGGKRWLKHGGWWPDYQIRLIKQGAFKSWPKQIHSTPQIEGEMGFLRQPLIHLAHGNVEGMVDKTLVFEDIESDLLFEASKKASTHIFFRKYFGELFRRLIKYRGFLDGKIGIIESIYQAYSKTITYLMLYEKQLRSSKTRTSDK